MSVEQVIIDSDLLTTIGFSLALSSLAVLITVTTLFIKTYFGRFNDKIDVLIKGSEENKVAIKDLSKKQNEHLEKYHSK